MRFWLFICLVLGLAPYSHGGATTQPALQPAAQLVQALGQSLADGDANSLTSLLTHTTLRSMRVQDESNARNLVAMFIGTKLVSARVYPGAPISLAADLADDFSSNQQVPQAIRQRMNPADTPRANDVGSRWVQRLLKPAAGQFVGVLVFYQPPVLDSSDAGRVLFALLKMQSTESDISILEIVYGDPATAH